MRQKIQTLDLEKITNEMNDKGFSLVSNLLSDDQCEEKLKSNYNQTSLYRENSGNGTISFWKGRI